MVPNNNNISKVKEIQDKKLCSLLDRNMGNDSDICQDPDKDIFNFSGFNLMIKKQSYKLKFCHSIKNYLIFKIFTPLWSAN